MNLKEKIFYKKDIALSYALFFVGSSLVNSYNPKMQSFPIDFRDLINSPEAEKKFFFEKINLSVSAFASLLKIDLMKTTSPS